MVLERPDKISAIFARIADLRKRAHAEADPISKFEFRGMMSNRQVVLDSYRLVQNRELSERCRIEFSANSYSGRGNALTKCAVKAILYATKR